MREYFLTMSPAPVGLVTRFIDQIGERLKAAAGPYYESAITPQIGSSLFGIVTIGSLILIHRSLGSSADRQGEGDEADPRASSSKSTKQRPRRTTLDDEASIQENGFRTKPIGTVRSIYKLCVGTPRQGLLAPHSRGQIELTVPHDAVDGLDLYSHIWVIFVFHLNTQSSSSKNGSDGRIGSGERKIPSKISPPAMGGGGSSGGPSKVGVLATRSPHRYNPIGITLCKLDSITPPNKHSGKTVLNVSGLDLVDSTPVLDIKPFVGYYDSIPVEEYDHVPSWVTGGLATLRPVQVESRALEDLADIFLANSKALSFYGPDRHGGHDKTLEATIQSVTQCMTEVLSCDVRSSWQTNKARKGQFQAERSDRIQQDVHDYDDDYEDYDDDAQGEDDGVHQPYQHLQEQQQCTQQLDNLLIHYTIVPPDEYRRNSSEGSGAEDTVVVRSIELLNKNGSSSSTEVQEKKSPTKVVNNRKIEMTSANELDLQRAIAHAMSTDTDVDGTESDSMLPSRASPSIRNDM